MHEHEVRKAVEIICVDRNVVMHGDHGVFEDSVIHLFSKSTDWNVRHDSNLRAVMCVWIALKCCHQHVSIDVVLELMDLDPDTLRHEILALEIPFLEHVNWNVMPLADPFDVSGGLYNHAIDPEKFKTVSDTLRKDVGFQCPFIIIHSWDTPSEFSGARFVPIPGSSHRMQAHHDTEEQFGHSCAAILRKWGGGSVDFIKTAVWLKHMHRAFGFNRTFEFARTTYGLRDMHVFLALCDSHDSWAHDEIAYIASQLHKFVK